MRSVSARPLAVNNYLVPGSLLSEIKLLGFKDRETLLFEDNIKHSNFVYPDELVRSLPGPHSTSEMI